MKKYLFSVLLSFIAYAASAQIYVNGKDITADTEKLGQYLEICPFQILENRVRFRVDYGQVACNTPFTWDRCVLTDANGTQKRFDSVVEGLNFFYQNGWEVWQTYIVDEDSRVYLLRRVKEADADSN
jgi:hypothetical protein